MKSQAINRRHRLKFVLVGATVISSHALAASPQDATPPPAPRTAEALPPPARADQAAVPGAAGPDIVVTGIRGSLQNATRAKRNSVTFGDSIFAEDIGKLPATNLAETLNRIPGVNLQRDIDGEGVNVSIRGLGPNFSNILLNDSQIAVASDGGTNGHGSARSVDLDLFPSELFTRLDVQKTPTASTLEGGIAGTVNLHNARPFDHPGTHVTLVGQSEYQDSNNAFGPRGALVASKTWGDTFGVLIGVAGIREKERIDGFESIGWTNGTVACDGCATTGSVGNGFFYAPVVPNNTGFGLVPGQPVDLAATSGLSLQQLDAALIPRLARNISTVGTRSRISAIFSTQFRPSEKFHFTLDAMYAKSNRNYQELAMNWYVRNSGPGTSPTSTGGMVPINITTDSNNVVTSGTFANSSFFMQDEGENADVKFWSVHPQATWRPSDKVEITAQGDYSHSSFVREMPQFDIQTPYESGITVDFENKSGEEPQVIPNVDLADPNLGWRWYRVNVQDVKRNATSKGAHLDARFGDDDFNVKIGGAYDDIEHHIRAFDNSAAFQDSVCGPKCDGLTGSVPNSEIGQYLGALSFDNFGHLADSGVGYTNFIQPNLAALEQATNYAYYNKTAPETTSAVTGGPVGSIGEKTFGAYFELNGLAEIFGRDLRVNFGTRYYHTQQHVEGPIQLADGIVDLNDTRSYDGFLPQANVTYDVTRHLKLRFAVSRSMTRPDPELLLPGTTFSDVSAQVASSGNPELKPYTSNNIDVGGEYYTGGSGYIGVDYFHKSINGFTENVQTTEPFLDLGIPFSALTGTQQDAINDRGGPNAAQVVVTEPINLDVLYLNGIELTWVQPLDFIVRGLGFSANGTHIKQKSPSGLVATGISPYSYNLQGYYEAHGVSLSVNYVWQDKSIAANAPQNNLDVPLRDDAHGQLDISAGYQLPMFNKALRLTVDAINVTNEPIREEFGYKNAPNFVYYPGRQILFGIRAAF